MGIDHYNILTLPNSLQARVQELVRGGGGAQNLKAFFFAFQFFRGGGPAQKRTEKMIF